MSSTPNFLPQLGITQSILEGIQLANEQKAQKQADAAKQRSLDISQQEANTASQRLAVETPHYQAQQAHLLTQSQLEAQALARNQFASDYLSGNSGHGSEPHIAAVVGQNHAFGVPQEAPPVQAQPLNISQPIGETLAVPSAPDTTAPAVSTPGSESASAGPTTSSTPVQATQPQGGIFADIAEIGRRIGGFTDQENQLGLYIKDANAPKLPDL